MLNVAHQRFLDIAHAYRLKWAYEHIDNYPKNLEQLIENTIDSSIEDVITEIKLHHEIINSKKLPLPLRKYIIPKSTVKWNLKKGGSDAATKILELFPANLYVGSTQAKYNIITSEGKTYASVCAYKDACNY